MPDFLVDIVDECGALVERREVSAERLSEAADHVALEPGDRVSRVVDLDAPDAWMGTLRIRRAVLAVGAPAPLATIAIVELCLLGPAWWLLSSAEAPPTALLGVLIALGVPIGWVGLFLCWRSTPPSTVPAAAPGGRRSFWTLNRPRTTAMFLGVISAPSMIIGPLLPLVFLFDKGTGRETGGALLALFMALATLGFAWKSIDAAGTLRPFARRRRSAGHAETART